MTYTIDLEVPLTVEVVHAARGHRGGRWHAPEPDAVELRVSLGTLDVTQALEADVLADLEADALERLAAAAGEP